MNYIQKGLHYFTQTVKKITKSIFWIVFSIAAIILFLIISDMYVRGIMTDLMANVIIGYIIIMSCFVISVIYQKRSLCYAFALIIIGYLAFVASVEEFSPYLL